MTRKNVILIISVLLGIVAVGGFWFHRSDPPSRNAVSPPRVAEQSPLPMHPTRIATKAKPGEDRTLLHPLADPEKRNAYRQQPITSWEQWAKALTEIDLGSDVEDGFILTPNEVVLRRNHFSQHWNAQARRYKKKNHPVPATAIELPYLDESKYYEGPQTSEAIMTEFDDRYDNSFPRAAEMEETYPREAFLQRLLDKGAVVKDVADYKYYMKLRGELLYRKDRPEDWRSGNHGILITVDFAEYEEGFLDRKVWENSITQQVSEANPDRSITVYFPASRPDKYLPVIGKMRYVRLGKNRESMYSFGSNLTKEQEYNLWHKGIESEDMEIVYIDDDFNVLSEPPPLANKATQVHNHHHVTVDGVQLTPENYESVVGHSMPAEWLEEYEARQARETQETTHDPNAARREAAREAASAAQAAAKAEYEKFENRMRQIEEFATLSDAEIEKTLEKQFRQKFLPQHPLEQLEHFTPERLEKALGTLFQHGFDEGFRRISRDSPALAEQLKQYFGQGQKLPAGKLPKGPVPPAPETAPPEADTD